MASVADSLSALICQVRAGRPEGVTNEGLPKPGEIAWQLYDAAGRLTAASESDEKDLRQVITTLRTALTVAWDMYDLPQSERTTVYQHIERLRTTIQGFEADLGDLQAAHLLEPRS